MLLLNNIQCSFHLSVFLDSTQYLDPDFLHLHDLKLNFLKLVAGGKTIVFLGKGILVRTSEPAINSEAKILSRLGT